MIRTRSASAEVAPSKDTAKPDEAPVQATEAPAETVVIDRSAAEAATSTEQLRRTGARGKTTDDPVTATGAVDAAGPPKPRHRRSNCARRSRPAVETPKPVAAEPKPEVAEPKPR